MNDLYGNFVSFVGRLTSDPIISFPVNRNGDKFCKAMFVVAKSKVDKYGYKEDIVLVPCRCSGQIAQYAKTYLKKGAKVDIKGQLESNSYLNEKGEKVFNLHLIVKRFLRAYEDSDTKTDIVQGQN